MDDIKLALLGDHEAAKRLTEEGVLLMQGDCLELLKDMLGESDKVYFIPEGTDITLFLGNEIPTKALPNQ